MSPQANEFERSFARFLQEAPDSRLVKRLNAGQTAPVSDKTSEIATFYASLPAKRMAAGLVCRDLQGRVLLVRPTYKTTWHVPGGVVDAGESPYAAALREAREELGLDVEIGRLLVVDWLPPQPPKTEGLMFLFDGSVLEDDVVARIVLPEEELEEWAFVEASSVSGRVSHSLGARLAAALECLKKGETRYLEAGVPLAP